MTIIDKSRRSPYFVYKPPPIFNSTYEEQKWLAQEKKKWIEGDGDVPPMLYFYLSQGFVKHRVVPEGHDSVERPMARFASLWMHQEFERTKKKKKVQMVFKGRNVGLSTEAGAICNYYARVHAGSNCIVTSKDQDGISVFFQEKIYVPYQHMDSRIRPDELAKNATKQKCYLKLGVSHLGNDGNEKYSISTINLRETSDTPRSPQNFSGQGAAFGCFDELPLHPRKEELLNSAIECFRNPFTKELDGFLLAGGTFEESMTPDDIQGFKNLIDNKELWDCEIMFVPFWWSFKLDAAGYPDEKGAFEWWETQAEKLQKYPSKLNAFIRNNPRTMEDIFETASGGRWEDDTLEVLKAQRTAVLNADISCPKYHFVNLNKTVTPTLNNNGKFWMLETVQPQCKYALLIDGITKGTDVGNNEGSKFASVVVKTLDPRGTQYLAVNIYCERPKTTEAAHYNVLNQILYYNQFGGVEIIQMEANAGMDSFWTFMTKEGFHHLIGRAKDLSGKGWTNKNNLGQQRTPNIIKFQYEQGNIFIRKYPQALQMLPLIDELLTPMSIDSHITDAWLQFFCAYPNFDERPKPKPKPKPKTMITMVMEGGRTVLKEVAI